MGLNDLKPKGNAVNLMKKVSDKFGMRSSFKPLDFQCSKQIESV